MANESYNEKLKKYIDMYSTLKQVKDEDKNSSLLTEDQSNIIYTGLESTTWTEIGKNVIITDGVPYLKGSLENISDSINNNLLEANSILYNKVYPLLEDISNLKEEYDTLYSKTILDSSDTVTADSFKSVKTKLDEDMLNIDNYLQDIDKLGKEVKTTSVWLAGHEQESSKESGKIDLVSYTGGSKSADHIASIKNTHAILEAESQGIASSPSGTSKSKETYATTTKTTKSTTKTTTTKTTTAGKGNTYTYNGLGGSWTVAKTPQDLNSYLSFIKNNGVFQASNTGRYGDSCLAFAEVYGSNLKTGNKNNAEQAYSYCCASSYKNYFNDSEKETMREVYNQITAGNPVVIQVNGNSQGTCRHFVTVVGFKSSVTSGDNLKASDLLIVDSWDGQLERMDTSSSRFLTTGAQCHKNYSGYYLRILQ